MERVELLRHDFREGGLEFIHLRLRADRYAHVIRPSRPGASDDHVFRGQRGYYFGARPANVHHEMIRFALHKLDVLFVEEGEDIVANIGVDFLALGDNGFRAEAGGGGGDSGDGHETDAIILQLGEKIGTAGSVAGALPSSTQESSASNCP